MLFKPRMPESAKAMTARSFLLAATMTLALTSSAQAAEVFWSCKGRATIGYPLSPVDIDGATASVKIDAEKRLFAWSEETPLSPEPKSCSGHSDETVKQPFPPCSDVETSALKYTFTIRGPV